MNAQHPTHPKPNFFAPLSPRHPITQDCVRRDAAAVHARGECQALVGLARLGVEGDSQPMRLALRIACLNAVAAAAGGDGDGAASSPFHTPAFVRGLDHHFEEAPAPVRQGVLAVAQALGAFMRVYCWVLIHSWDPIAHL